MSTHGFITKVESLQRTKTLQHFFNNSSTREQKTKRRIMIITHLIFVSVEFPRSSEVATETEYGIIIYLCAE